MDKTMTPTSFVAEIDVTLRQHADAQIAFDMRAYLLNQFEFLGIRAPVRRQAVKAITTNTVWTSPQEVMKVAQLLWEKPEREFRYTAIDFLKRHAKWFDVSHLPELLHLLQREPWWETVDGLASVIGLIMRRQVQTGVLDAQHICDDWIEHSDFWVRRCAMLHQLGWRLDTDTNRLFRYSEQLALEDEFFIRKAIGWALRDYARWNPTAVQNYIEQKQGIFSGLTVREATKHLK